MITKPSLDNTTKIFSKILPIYWAFLTYMLLKPGTENQEYWFMFPGFDKFIHFSTFAALGFILRASFPKITLRTYIYIMLIYALLTEILQEQMHLGRSAETLDLLADTIGSLMGYFIYQKIAALRKP